MDTLINALVPISIFAVAAIVATGLYGLFKGGEFNKNWSNRLMRMRVLVQFIAVILIMTAIWLSGRDPTWF